MSNTNYDKKQMSFSRNIRKKETSICTYFHLNNNKFNIIKKKKKPYSIEKHSFFQVMKYYFSNELPQVQDIYATYNELENKNINIQNKSQMLKDFLSFKLNNKK